MSAKAGLKAAKAALDSENYDTAITEAQKVLSSDGQNYFARLFLARAYEKQGKFDEAAQTYEAAATSKPDDSQAWLGLCSVYEGQGSKHVDEYLQASMNAAIIFGKAEDLDRCQTIIDRVVSFSKQRGTSAQYKRALELHLPGSPVYEFLEGRVPPPSHTYTRLAEITEDEEDRFIKQEIASRRTRLGAKLGQVTTDVKREVFASSQLSHYYREIINWTGADDVRREYEEKLLAREYDLLIYSPADDKSKQLDAVLTLAEGMVIIHHSFQLAWDLVLESRDLEDLRQVDADIIREYVDLFPQAGLGKILKSWLSSELCPFPPVKASDDDNGVPLQLSPEDRLLLMTEGLSESEDSAFAHRLVGDYLLHLEEYESTADTARTGLQTLAAQSVKLGLSMQNTKDALDSVLATALVYYQTPRHHAEARKRFEDVLSRRPKSTQALVGLGLILEENEEYARAIEFLTQALQEDPDNVRVGTELAWCRAQNHDYARAQQELESYLSTIKADDPRTRELRAQVLYRIGICVWEQDSSKAARKSREGAYASFLAAIRTNVNFAAAYTSLGVYYADYAKDRKRARQCFQKAFELSPSETLAAKRLAKSFADQGDWDIVEVIAQRVIDTGRARPPPGSKRKGLSWPYSALGVVQMNKHEYQMAITSFLAALRIDPLDYQSYVGLGESYHNSGRYNSALRTFNHALELRGENEDDTWFARYMLAAVCRELGEYEEAIKGLKSVLEPRPEEFGVLISLLQTLAEKSWRCLETGLFGQAIESAREAISVAEDIARNQSEAFNLWKAVGDACMVFSCMESNLKDFPAEALHALLNKSASESAYEALSNVDLITLAVFSASNAPEGDPQLSIPLKFGILAYKRAIYACSHDIHAQAVAWYNLGLAEQRAYHSGIPKQGRRYLKAAVRCFKRSIELEAGNAEFWNALGVVTSTLNPKVAQHSLIRSLHLNELNAKVWTNLGVLYLLQNDHELAHQAFGRAQSTDPDYAHAWVGEGLIALLLGDLKEGLSHFTHAFEISDSVSTITKQQYALSAFDHLLATPSASNDLTALIQPIFALEQLHRQDPYALPFQHLAALFFERVGNHAAATDLLTSCCASAESEYEATESLPSLARYAHAKADLARNQLATLEFEATVENAKTVLDLSSDSDNCGLDTVARRRLRLSAHLTAGLASSYLQKSSEAVIMFKVALEESNADPEVVCSLVKVLWAHGGEEERSVAREQLFDCVEKHPEHVDSVALLGAISALEGDVDTMAAVEDDLIHLRAKNGLNAVEKAQIEDLLYAFAALDSPGSGEEDDELAEVQSAILLGPENARAWSRLSDLSGHTYAAKMALATTRKAVPPMGAVPAEGIGRAFAAVGTLGDAQRSVVFAPWKQEGWDALGEGLGQNL